MKLAKNFYYQKDWQKKAMCKNCILQIQPNQFLTINLPAVISMLKGNK